MSDPTFYEWLRSQSESFQNDAIGSENADQLRSGELDSKRFYAEKMHKQFKPMSLDQMRQAETQD